MSDDDSRARSTGPFVQIVASATWLAAIDGFFSTASSSSTCVSSCSCGSSFASLSLRVRPDRVADLEILALDLKTHGRSLLRARLRGLTLSESSAANCPRERDHLDLAARRRAGARTPPRRRSSRSCRRRRRGRRAAAHACRRRGRVGDVPPALGEREAALRTARGGAVDERLDRQLPAAAELPRERRRRDGGRARARAPDRPAPGRAPSTPGGGSSASADERGGEPRRAGGATGSFQPATSARTAVVVDDGRARGGEGEPPAGALRAAAHRPGAGAPQRAQSGGRIRAQASEAGSHAADPGVRQTTQRCGNRSSSTRLRRYAAKRHVSCRCVPNVARPDGGDSHARRPAVDVQVRDGSCRDAGGRERLAYGARWTPSSVTIAAISSRRRDVERRVAGREAVRDLGRVALLDRDPGARGRGEVDGRGRRDDVERDPVVRARARPARTSRSCSPCRRSPRSGRRR